MSILAYIFTQIHTQNFENRIDLVHHQAGYIKTARYGRIHFNIIILTSGANYFQWKAAQKSC